MEYAAIIALVAALAAALFMVGLPRIVSDEIEGAVDDGLEASEPVPSEGAGAEKGDPEEPTNVDPAPYVPQEGQETPRPAVWADDDDFVVQQTWSVGEFWEWGTGGRPAFEFEDHGDYNWDCGWVLHYFCRAGGGLAQGADETLEDGRTALCHFHLCSSDDFDETWSNTRDSWNSLWEDPIGGLGDMWDGLWEAPNRNNENLSDSDAFVKDLGYWLTQIPGAPLKPFRFFGDGGSSSDRDGDGARDRNELDCSNSFISGTLVLLTDGTAKPIEQVTVGDSVLAHDPTTGTQGEREVTHVFSSGGEKTLVDVEIDDGSEGKASVTATENHPFWVSGQGWTDAIDLEQGSWLRSSSGVWVQVSAIDVQPTSHQQVHNLTVQDLHTYHVLAGDSPVLVHNSEGCDWSSHQENAGDLSDQYTEGQSTRDPASQWYHEELSNDELLDSINNAAEGEGIAVSPGGTIVGGHHRWDELQTRINDGRIDPDTPIRIDVYGED